MYYTRKLKDEFGIGRIWPVLVILALFALAVIFFGIKAGLTVMFISFASYSCFSIISYLRTRNISFLAGSIYQAFMALYFLTVSNGPFPIESRSSRLFLFSGILCAVWLVVLSIQKKTKWKGSEMFELAYLLNPNYSYENRTWVAFDFTGRISVNISKNDYMQYKDELSFDHLCDSLGKVLLEFLEYSKKGEHERILYKLNSLKLNPMT